MSDVQEKSPGTDRQQGDEHANPIVRMGASLLIWIRGSFIAFVGTLGVVFLLSSFVLSGRVLPGVTHRILAAMCLVWAVSSFLYAIAGYGLLNLIGYN